MTALFRIFVGRKLFSFVFSCLKLQSHFVNTEVVTQRRVTQNRKSVQCFLKSVHISANMTSF